MKLHTEVDNLTKLLDIQLQAVSDTRPMQLWGRIFFLTENTGFLASHRKHVTIGKNQYEVSRCG